MVKTFKLSSIIWLFTVILLLTSGCAKPIVGVDEVEEELVNHLNDLYGSEFVLVETESRSGRGFFPGAGDSGTSLYLTRVHPEENEEMVVDVWWYHEKELEDISFADDYLDLVWSIEGQEAEASKLNEIYKEGAFVDYKMSYFSWFTSEERKKLKDLSYKKALQSFEKRNRLEFYIDYYIFIEGNLDKEQEATRLYNYIEENLLAYKPGKYNIRVYYINKDNKAFIDEIQDELFVNREDIQKWYSEGKLLNYVFLGNGFSFDNQPSVFIENEEDMLDAFQY